MNIAFTRAVLAAKQARDSLSTMVANGGCFDSQLGFIQLGRYREAQLKIADEILAEYGVSLPKDRE